MTHVTVLSCEYPPFPGSIGNYAGELLDALRNEGVPVTVIAPDYRREGLPAPSQFSAEEDTHRLLGHHRILPRALLPLLRLLRNTPRDSLLLAANVRATLLLYLLKPLHRRPCRAMVQVSHLQALRALAIAQDKHQVKNLVYVAAGRAEPGDYPERLQREAQALGIQLVLPGRLSGEDLKCLARRACAHLLLAQALPGKIEGFGLVLLETAGQGCPSIANSVGGIPEVLAISGSLVRHDELFTAAANIAAYAEDLLLRETQGERARERAALFTWKACAERTFPELNLGV